MSRDKAVEPGSVFDFTFNLVLFKYHIIEVFFFYSYYCSCVIGCWTMKEAFSLKVIQRKLEKT